MQNRRNLVIFGGLKETNPPEIYNAAVISNEVRDLSKNNTYKVCRTILKKYL